MEKTGRLRLAIKIKLMVKAVRAVKAVKAVTKITKLLKLLLKMVTGRTTIRTLPRPDCSHLTVAGSTKIGLGIVVAI